MTIPAPEGVLTPREYRGREGGHFETALRMRDRVCCDVGGCGVTEA